MLGKYSDIWNAVLGPDKVTIEITLDVDHINENWLDDRLENLRFLCPNCHSQFSRNLLPE